jgi:hypothetical protein
MVKHQRRDRDGLGAFRDDENVKLAPRFEAFPPRADPFMTQKGMIDQRLIDQPIPHRPHTQKRLVVLDELDPEWDRFALRFGSCLDQDRTLPRPVFHSRHDRCRVHDCILLLSGRYPAPIDKTVKNGVP